MSRYPDPRAFLCEGEIYLAYSVDVVQRTVWPFSLRDRPAIVELPAHAIITDAVDADRCDGRCFERTGGFPSHCCFVVQDDIDSYMLSVAERGEDPRDRPDAKWTLGLYGRRLFAEFARDMGIGVEPADR